MGGAIECEYFKHHIQIIARKGIFFFPFRKCIIGKNKGIELIFLAKEKKRMLRQVGVKVSSYLNFFMLFPSLFISMQIFCLC